MFIRLNEGNTIPRHLTISVSVLKVNVNKLFKKKKKTPYFLRKSSQMENERSSYIQDSFKLEFGYIKYLLLEITLLFFFFLRNSKHFQRID